MSAILLTPPALEPVSLADAKHFLRVAHDDDDEVIAALIAAARVHVEAQTRRALITQAWRLVIDAWPADGRLKVLPAPLAALDAVRVHDDSGATGLDLQSFVVDKAGSQLVFAPWAMAQPGRAAAGIEVDITAGYGDAASDVPEPLRHAVRLLIAHWYENRGIAGPGGTLPATVAALIAPYRMLSL